MFQLVSTTFEPRFELWIGFTQNSFTRLCDMAKGMAADENVTTEIAATETGVMIHADLSAELLASLKSGDDPARPYLALPSSGDAIPEWDGRQQMSLSPLSVR